MNRKAFALPLMVALAGCGDSPGSMDLNIWGEEYIFDEVPSRSGTDAGFENGWSLHYSRFLINLGGIVMTAADGSNANPPTGYRIYNMHLTEQPFRVTSLSALNPVRYNNVGYTLAPTTDASTAGNASADDVAFMKTNHFSVFIEGEGRKDGTTPVHFAWGFGGTTAFTDCHDSTNQEGFVVPAGGRATVQFTIHGDHPFYDDLQSETALLRFDLIASADSNMDHNVTLEELAAVDLTRAPTGQYGVGAARDVTNLRQFITSLVSTIGHFNGEGHCQEHRS